MGRSLVGGGKTKRGCRNSLLARGGGKGVPNFREEKGTSQINIGVE